MNSPFLPFFEAEAVALKQIEDTHTIRVPKVISVGKTVLIIFSSLGIY